MNYSTYRFTLDLQKHQSQHTIDCFRGDTAIKLIISFTDGGKPYLIGERTYAILFGKKLADEDNKLVHSCEISNGGTEAIYTFEKSTTSVSGIVDCQLRLYGEDHKLITAPRFIINVDTQVVTDDDVEVDEDHMSALDDIFETEKARQDREALRILYEEQRIANETGYENEHGVLIKGRVQNEEIREQNEYGYWDVEKNEHVNGRVDNEETRKANEEQRIIAEEGELQEDGTRLGGRKLAELYRQSAEELRKDAENGFTNDKGEFVKGRTQNEAERIANEEIRVQNEKDRRKWEDGYTDENGDHVPGRIENEEKRKQNEEFRVNNEDERIQNEKGYYDDTLQKWINGRVDNEQIRVDNEQKRVDEEKQRLINEYGATRADGSRIWGRTEKEAERVNNELKRVAAENAREERFNAHMSAIEGKTRAYTFDNFEALATALGITETEPLSEHAITAMTVTVNGTPYGLRDGDVCYLVPQGVPDYWISMTNKKIYKLEAEHVDLAGYVQSEKGKSLVSDDLIEKLKDIDEKANNYAHPDMTIELTGAVKGTATTKGDGSATIETSFGDNATYVPRTELSAGSILYGEEVKTNADGTKKSVVVTVPYTTTAVAADSMPNGSIPMRDKHGRMWVRTPDDTMPNDNNARTNQVVNVNYLESKLQGIADGLDIQSKIDEITASTPSADNKLITEKELNDAVTGGDSSKFMTKTEFDKYVAELNYKPITITSRSADPSIVRVGQDTEVDFEIICSKEIESVKFEGDSEKMTIDGKTATYTTTVNLTKKTAYEVEVTEKMSDVVDNQAYASCDITVLVSHQIKYGVYGFAEKYTDLFNALEGSEWSDSRKIDFEAKATEKQYFYVCMPEALGECKFKSGTEDAKFVAELKLIATTDLKNEDGYPESYRIYRSDGLGNDETVHIYVS